MAETPQSEADWDAWQQDRRATRKTPLKRQLLAAQAKVAELLERVIRDGETVTINDDDGNPVATMAPYKADD